MVEIHARLIAFAIFVTGVATAQDRHLFSFGSLKGIEAIADFVEPLGTYFEARGLQTSAIQADVDRQLRGAGFKLTGAGWNIPNIYIQVTRLCEIGNADGILVELSVNQFAELRRDRTIYSDMTTWRTRRFVVLKKNKILEVRHTARDLVDEFIKAFLAVNPKLDEKPGNRE